jgi:hypothetical protein
MTAVKVTRGVGRSILFGVLLGAAACGLFSACSSMLVAPTYTDDEQRAICERRGGLVARQPGPRLLRVPGALMRSVPAAALEAKHDQEEVEETEVAA